MATTFDVGVYAITTPSGKVYVGQSWGLKRRFRKYHYLNCKRQPKLYTSLKKYGLEACSVQVLRGCSTQAELDFYEIAFMYHYRMLGKELLNLKEGGGGGKYSEESKKRMSISHKKAENGPNLGRKFSQEWRNNISAAKRGVPIPGRPIVDMTTGKVYQSAAEAARAIGLKRSTLGEMLRGKNPNKTPMRYAP